MSTLKVNNLQVGQDSTATNNLTWFQPGTPDGTIRLGSGNAGSATSKFTFDKDGNLTCVGTITATSVEATIDDWIVHDSDTNTKFGFPTTDQISFHTNGSERLHISTTGRVGINDSSGNARFIVKGDSDTDDADCQIRIYDTDSTAGSQIPSVSFWGGSTEIGRIRGTDTYGMKFYTANSGTLGDRMSIGADGNVHINTDDNGTANAKLNIENSTNNSSIVLKIINKPSSANGKARLEFYSETSSGQGCSPYIQSVSGTDARGSNSANDGGLEFHTTSGGSGTDVTAMHLNADGKVGIMNTNPAEVLDVSGNIRVDAGSNGLIDFGDCNSSSVAFGRLYADSTGTFIGSKTNHDLIFRTNHTEKARLGINGQLGVGVTANWGNSAYKGIHVHSSGGTNTYVTLTNNATGSNSASDGFSLAYSSTDINFLNRETGTFMFTSGGAERLRIDNNGRMKINHNNTSGQLDDTFLSIYDANSASGISKNYAMIALHNYGTGSPGDVAGIGFGAGSGFNYTKGSIGFARSSGYGRGDLVFCTNNDGDTTLVNDTDERMRITREGYVGIGETPVTKIGITLAVQVADGTDDASDWGAGGVFQLNASGSAAANNEILLVGAHSGGVGQIASGFGFGRESTSNWGTYLSFKTHETGTSNIDSLIERVRIPAAGGLQVINAGVSLDNGWNTQWGVSSSRAYIQGEDANGNNRLMLGAGNIARFIMNGTDGSIEHRGSTSSTLTYTFKNETSAAGGDLRILLKSYANSGADPYIKFDAGGTDMVVGTYYGGTTNNKLVLGYGASPSGGVTGIHIYGNGEFYQNSANNQTTASAANAYWDGSSGRFLRSTSSIKFKTNVQTLLDSDADKILQCRPVTYQPKDTGDNTQGSDSSKTFYGLIAEEVEVIDPRLVGYDSEGTVQNVEYARFVPHIINLLQRQQKEIETLKTELNSLKSS